MNSTNDTEQVSNDYTNNNVDEDDDGNTTPRTVALVLPMICAYLSMISCYILIRENIADLHPTKQQQSRKKVKAVIDPVIPKQFISMCVAYLFWYFGLAMGPIPAPQELDVLGASGNIASCTTVGFFFQFGLFAAVPLHTCLIWFYMVMVRYNWQHDRMTGYFNWLNLVIWIGSFVAASVPAYFGYYNFTGTNCWLASYPQGCDNDDPEKPPCMRGANVSSYKVVVTAFPYFPCWIAFIILFVMIYKSVRNVEDRSRLYAGIKTRFSFRPRPSSTDKTSRTTTDQKQSTALGPSNNNNLQQQQQQEAREVFESEHAETEEEKSSPALQETNNNNNHHGTVQAPRANFITEQSTNTSSSSSSNNNNPAVNRTKSKAVASQAMLLCTVVFLAIALNAAARAVSIKFGAIPYAFNLFVDVFLALTGVFNAIIFCYPRDMKTPEGKIFRNLFFCCGLCGAEAREKMKPSRNINPSSEETIV